MLLLSPFLSLFLSESFASTIYEWDFVTYENSFCSTKKVCNDDKYIKTFVEGNNIYVPFLSLTLFYTPRG
jgi:hypothetical protein